MDSNISAINPHTKAHVRAIKMSNDLPQQATVDPLLTTILSWPRRHDSPSEQKFCAWLRSTIKGVGYTPRIAALGCIVVEVGYGVDNPTIDGLTLFSCHVDTIDPALPPVDVLPKMFTKTLAFDPNFGEIILDKGSLGGSLGADDGVGVWIMLKMIEAKVPGSYVFHRGEELHGLGSAAMLKDESQWLSRHDLAVAFDRPGDYEVITHQGGAECASNKFATALCASLKVCGLDYTPSSRGVFTDTKMYRGVIAECTNLGVGYVSQHSTSESLNYNHAFALMEAAKVIAWDSLPADRDPTKPDPVVAYANLGRYGAGRWGDYDMFGESAQAKDFGGRWDSPKPSKPAPKPEPVPYPPAPKESAAVTAYDNLRGTPYDVMQEWAEEDPMGVVDSVCKLMLEIAALRAQNEMLAEIAGVNL